MIQVIFFIGFQATPITIATILNIVSYLEMILFSFVRVFFHCYARALNIGHNVKSCKT